MFNYLGNLMPSHQISSTELKLVNPRDISKTTEETLLERWKNEIDFDYELELGIIAKRVARSTRIADVDKADTLIKLAGSVKSIHKAIGEGKGPSGNVQVNVMTVDPTKRDA